MDCPYVPPPDREHTVFELDRCGDRYRRELRHDRHFLTVVYISVTRSVISSDYDVGAMNANFMRHDAPRPEPRGPTPGEHLFTMRRAGEAIVCELHDHGELGCEAQVLLNGQLLIAQRFDGRALTIGWAEFKRGILAVQGWFPDPSSDRPVSPRS
jgi:hypothetical protein